MSIRLPGLLLITTLLLVQACDSHKTPPQPPATKYNTAAIDTALTMAIKDTTLQSWQPPSPQAEGADIKALLKNEQVVMIEEERVDADTATLHRYFFKNNRLILASSLQMNACIDTSQMCVTEMRCYFDEDKMICEYSRSLSLPVNASGELDPSKLENYLHDQAYDTTSPNPTKGRQLLKESEILRERILQQSTPQG